MIAFKLLHVRANGTVGPLFIERKRVLNIEGEIEWANMALKPKGYATRPGFHTCANPYAPHLKLSHDRCWFLVEIGGNITEHERPECQGGTWYTSNYIKLIRPITLGEQNG